MDVLVLGVNPEINSAVKNMLEEKGVSTQTSTDLDNAPKLFNAKDFKVICLGAGLPLEIRSSLKEAFKSQDQNISVVETFPQVAIAHIIRALKEKQGDFELAQNFSVLETAENFQLSFQLNHPCPIQIDLYQVQDGKPVGRQLFENANVQGTFTFGLNKSLIVPALNLATIVINHEPYFFFATN